MVCSSLSNTKPKELEGIMTPVPNTTSDLQAGAISMTNEILTTYLFGSNQQGIHPMATIRIHLRYKKIGGALIKSEDLPRVE